jgi:flagellar protein FlaG
MNEFTKVSASPVPVKAAATSPLTGKAPSQKTGKDLPVAVKPATTRAADIADSEAMQESVKAAVAQMNEYIQSTQRDLRFSYDASSGETVVRVLDRTTQEVIRQIPDAIFLKLAQRVGNKEPFHFFNAQA